MHFLIRTKRKTIEILALLIFLTIMSPSSSHSGGSMDKRFPLESLSSEIESKDQVDLPSFPSGLESALSKGKSFQVEGTNVVRVPFGIRQSLKKRPVKQETWATLVLPFQPLGSPPTPPQAA